MARELGLSPQRMAAYGVQKDEPWKKPLKEFIKSQYEKQFGKTEPDVILTIEEMAAADTKKRSERKARKRESK